MISKRNYFTITLVMLVLAFLFQLTGGAKLVLSNFGVNEYADGYKGEEIKNKFFVGNTNDKAFICYYGMDENYRQMLREYCYYKRKNLVTCLSMEDVVKRNGRRKADMICIQGSILREADLDYLESLVKFGHRIAFLNMPDVSFVSQNQRFKDILGIVSVQAENYHLQGVHLNRGLLIGGEQYYEALTEEAQKQQDLELDIPWYVVGSGCTLYVNGIISDEEKELIQPGFYPAIIWSHHDGKSTIFAVQGDYMRDLSGIGILSSLEAGANEYTIYPVVNAECLVFENYPTFSYENSAKLIELYSRNAKAVERDMVWPGLASVVDNTDFVPSYTTSVYINDENADHMDKETVDAFFQLIREQHGEVGLAMGKNQDIDADVAFFKEHLPDYSFLFAGTQETGNTFVGAVTQRGRQYPILTLLSGSEGAERLVDASVGGFIGLKSVNDASDHTFSDDLRERAILTSLGYLMIAEDMSSVLYPENKDDEWQNKFDRLASNITTYYKPLKGFDHVTLSEAGRRARKYLNSTYETVKHGRNITLTTNASIDNERYYILRCPGLEIEKVGGASYREIEEDIYLITAYESKSNIIVKNRQVKKDK